MYRNTLTTITAVFTLTFNLVFTQVVINEIHFNPGSAQGSDNDYEFLELHNPGTTDIDISGYSFTEGINHVFADATTLAAGAYLVLAKNSDSYVGSIQWGSGSLTNGTEDIEIITAGVDGNGDGDFDDLGVDNNGDGDFDDAGVDNNGDGDFDDAGVDANGDGDFDDEGDTLPDVAADIAPVDTAPTVVDYVDYEFGDYGEIHGAADGGGGSLELLDAASDNSLAASWQVSWVVGGTPGAMSSSEPTATVLTIYNIQNTSGTGEDSPYLDEYVQTTGIVTGIDRIGTNSAFTIQDGSGSWNGIYCWWGADSEVVLGDEVTVKGTVVEYTAGGGDTLQSMTQLTGGYILSINSSGNALPAAVVLAVEDVGDEQYEGVLVTTSGKVVAAVNDDSYGEWRISNNLDASDMDADTINVNDRFAITDPAFGTIATVTGPLNQWSGSGNSSAGWRIEPASEEDVVIACTNADLTINIEMLDSYGDGWNGGYYEIRGPQGVLEGSGTLEGGLSAVDSYCMYVGGYFIYVIAGENSYPNEISFNVKDAFGNYLIAGGLANSGPFDYPFSVTGVNETTGCMDPAAVNYDQTAGVDDGSCYYEGDICESPIVMNDGNGVAASDIDQFFTYTAVATGNMTVSSVGQTEEDTYLSILGSCTIGYSYEIDPDTGDTLYVTSFYEDILATSDDADYGTGVYQSEATICVTAGETYIIGWISMYYPYDESFNFSVEETPDITVPVNMSAYGYEDGIAVSWAPIPVGCAGETEGSRSASSASNNLPFKFKPGAREHVVGKVRERNNTQRTEIRVPTLTRDCAEGYTEVSFYMAGGSWQSERTYEVYDSEDNLIASAVGAAVETPIEVCLTDGDYTVLGFDSYGDGWNGGVLYAALSDGSVIYSLGLSSGSEITDTFTFCGTCVYGCTDSMANNYDETATNDDGSCVYPGEACGDPLVVDPSVGVTDSEANWFAITIPADGDGKLTISNNSYEYYYLYASCEAVANGEYISSIYSSTSGELNFDSETLNYAGDATMDTYQGQTLIIRSYYQDLYAYERLTTINYQILIPGCMDPYSDGYNPDANVDDGSCVCSGSSLVMNMSDQYNDGWSGNGYMIVDAATNLEMLSGTLASGPPSADEFCLPDGDYLMYVGAAPADSGSWASEVSWSLTSAAGQSILAGGAPFNLGNDFQLPLPAFTFTLHRNNVVLIDELAALEYYDSSAVAGTEYCYAVSQTVGVDPASGFSEEDCSIVYVPSTCATATPIELDTINHIVGINGRDEWFSHTATLDGYLTMTSDIPGNDPYDNDTRFYVYADTSQNTDACVFDNLIQIGYDDDGGAGYLSTVTVVVDSGETYYLLEENYWSPGPSIFTAHEFPAGHQPPNNFTATADHEKNHLGWEYPLDAYSNAVRSVAPNGNTLEENRELISKHEDITEKMIQHRNEMYEGWVAIHGEPGPSDSRDLTGTTVSIMGSVLNDDGTADIIIGLDMISPNNAWLSGVRFTFPDGMVVNNAIHNEGSSSTYEYCGEWYIEGNVATFGDSAGVNDPSINPDGDWGCLWGGFHRFTINIDVFDAPIDMGYLIADDCYQDFDGTLGTCGDMVGTVPVPVPTDVPLCYNDDFEPNDFFESPDTWTVVGYPTFEDWSGNPLTVGATVCPGDVDIYTAEAVGYGGWVRVTIVDLESTGQMEVNTWDLSISEYSLYSFTSELGDTIQFSYQNYGGIDGSTGPAQLVCSVEGTNGAAQFEYDITIDVDQPEVYSYNVHKGDTDALVATGVLGYNYTDTGLANGTEYSYYAVTVNGDGLVSDTSVHDAATPRADVPFAPTNLVGEPWLESVNLSWDAPASLTPGNVIQSAFDISMLPHEATGNTADGFENNYDDCSDDSDSPDAVYKYTPATDTTLSISTCYSGFDTKVYVYENTSATMVACNEDAGFYDYYYCGYYTSYLDSVHMTGGTPYYIVVDGWGGDQGYYNLQVFARGDTAYTEGWDYDMVVTDPNHDPEQKALAVEEHLATIDIIDNSSSRSLVGFEVLRENSSVYEVIATPSGTEYSDTGLATATGETYSYRVKSVYDGGTSDASNTVTVTPFAPITVPTPVNFTASSDGWIVTLDWEEPELGGGDIAYSENFDDGTLGTMTTEDLNPGGGAVWVVGTTEDATSTYWSPPSHGSFAFYNDDFHQYEFDYTDARLTSASIDLSALTADAIAGLSLVGELYFTQPSGSCEDGGTYAEELELMVSVDGGDWVSRGRLNSTAGWDMIEVPLGLPGGSSSAKVGLRYSDCGGTWSYGVAVDNFAVMVPPELDLIGYNVYRDAAPFVFVPGGEEGLLTVHNEEGTSSYSVTTLLNMYGESAQAGPIDVVVTAPTAMMNPPRNLSVTAHGYSAELEWDPPAGGDQWIGYDSGEIGNALGSEEAFDYQVAVRFPAQDLIEFQGKHLQEIQFMGGQGIGASSYIVQVFANEAGTPVLLYESEIIPGSELAELDWNYHELEDPIPFVLGAEMWIGLRCISNGGVASYPTILDNQPAANNLGNLVNGFGSDGFISMLDGFGFDGNWMIRGFVSWPITNHLSNSGFEGWSPNPGSDWQTFPNDFNRMGSDGAPYGSMNVDPDGAGIYGSPDGSLLEVYDGERALKMWGMYAGGENMWGSVYQSFPVAELGGAGSEIDVSAFMMSHAHDWIGQGANSVTVFTSYWSGPYGYTYLSSEYSYAFNGTFAASEWHEIETRVTIPEGATWVNIGIEFLQPNNDQHGSVYLDNFTAAPVNEVQESVIQPLAISEIAPKRAEGIYSIEGRPTLMFDEYFPESENRDEAFEFLGYKVYRGSVALDTLGMGEHMYYDEVGESGAVEYHVSAVYEEDGTGMISEVNSEMVTVDLQNAAPTAVELISPDDNDVITLTAANVAGSDLGIFWSSSTDADGDQVEYVLNVEFAEYDYSWDTVLTATNIFIPYEDLYGIIVDSAGLTQLNITWNVHTADGWDVTPSSNGPWSLTVDAGWMLSTEEELLPEVFALHNNYPNPFNPITNIRYDIPEVSDVRIDVYNLAGQRVRTLVSREHQPGRYRIKWNATNDFGSPVASGMYIYRIHAKDFVSVKKLLLMK